MITTLQASRMPKPILVILKTGLCWPWQMDLMPRKGELLKETPKEGNQRAIFVFLAILDSLEILKIIWEKFYQFISYSSDCSLHFRKIWWRLMTSWSDRAKEWQKIQFLTFFDFLTTRTRLKIDLAIMKLLLPRMLNSWGIISKFPL